MEKHRFYLYCQPKIETTLEFYKINFLIYFGFVKKKMILLKSFFIDFCSFLIYNVGN